MTTMINQLTTWYTYLNDDLMDPRIKHLPFMSEPWCFLAVIGCYLYFILYFGPKFMEKRQSYKLDKILQIYNIFQIMISIFIFIEAVRVWFTEYNLICEPIDYSNSPQAVRIAKYVWLYFMNKVLDLLDTVFFVLKKKQNQMTFLHIYHHTGMAVGCWIAAKYLPGGHLTFLGLINTFIHSIMYLYYLLSSMKINTSYWKKHLTQLQILQFFLILVHYIALLFTDCGFPQWIAYIMIPQNLFIIMLFSDFYYKVYIKKKPANEAVKTNKEINGINVMEKKSKEQ